MKMIRFSTILIGIGLAFGGIATAENLNPAASGEKGTPSTEADNTKRNKLIENNNQETAQDQSNDQKNLDLAAKVRRAIVDDDSLSVNAHNVKILVEGGIVTLKGPVKSVTERNRINQIATEIAGAQNVKNELEVAH